MKRRSKIEEMATRARTRELAHSVEGLRALGEVMQAVNSTLDLQTVLSTIVAKAVQLSGTDGGAIPDLQKIEQSGRHLLNLINEVLDLSKIEAGKLELNPEPVNLSSLITELVGIAEQLAAKNDAGCSCR